MDATYTRTAYTNSIQNPSASIKNRQISVSVTKSADNVDSTPKACRELLSFSLHSSTRLRSIQQRTKIAVVSILDTGEVCLEFVKNRSNEERVGEIFLISPDGQQVTVNQPNG